MKFWKLGLAYAACNEHFCLSELAASQRLENLNYSSTLGILYLCNSLLNYSIPSVQIQKKMRPFEKVCCFCIRFKQGCGVGLGGFRTGVGLLKGLGVGVGIFYPASTPHVRFLYILVMLTAQLTRLRAPVQYSAVIFLGGPCRVSRDIACDS